MIIGIWRLSGCRGGNLSKGSFFYHQVSWAYYPGEFAPGSSFTVAGYKFELKQFHFYAPGEHTIEGYSCPVEGHLVHMDKDGKVAVIAVMFKPGASTNNRPIMPTNGRTIMK